MCFGFFNLKSEWINLLSSDVNVQRPDIGLYIRRVGVEGIRVPVFSVKINNRSAFFVPKVSAYIDLPAEYRGIHASRSYEAISEALSHYAGKKLKVEEFCSKVVKELLSKHSYGRRAEILLKGEVVFPDKTPVTGKETFETVVLMGRARAYRDEEGSIKITKAIGVKVTGITACPSAQKDLRDELKELLRNKVNNAEDAESILESLPIATHMQRSYSTLMIEVPENFSIDANTLIEIAKESMSASTYELLKKKDELKVIKSALSKPRFAEDVLRYMAKEVVERFRDLPGDTRVLLIQRDLESIHDHNLVAKYYASLRKLREEFRLRKD